MAMMILGPNGVLSKGEADSLIGHNNPPEPTPFEAWKTHLDDLRTEAGNWLDGSSITSQAEADEVSKLLDAFRKAGKDADKARADEKRPHDEAAKAVQAKWRPLLDTAERAADSCKQLLAPWLQKLEAERQAEAERVRKEAEEAARKAAEAMRAADPTDLAAREEAEAMVEAAKGADKAARKVEGAKTHATGGDRAIGLRTYYELILTDRKAALLHYLAQQPEAFERLIMDLAAADVRSGRRNIPGFDVEERKRVA